jgi:hypothetical protein
MERTRPSGLRSATTAALAAVVALLTLAPVALADHHPGLLRHVSTGPTDANGANAATFRAVSDDGSRAFFVTNERLTGDDTDNQRDVYQRVGSVTTLISIGPSGGNGALDADLAEITHDGFHVYLHTTEQLTSDDTDTFQDVYDYYFGAVTLVSTGPDAGGLDSQHAYFVGVADYTSVYFITQERLLAADADDYTDVYERSGGNTTLVSTGPTGGNGPFSAYLNAVSPDGSRAVFSTNEQLVATDTDGTNDIYERSGGTTTLVSTSSFGGNAEMHSIFDGASADATRVFFYTFEALEAADIDNSQDIYERAGGVTTRISTGPQGGNGTAWPSLFAGSSEDGTRVFMNTRERHVAADTDFWNDTYVRHGGTTELLSVGPVGGNAAIQALYKGNSADGTKVWFETVETLTSDDPGGNDLYENSNGTTTLVSTGPGRSLSPTDYGGQWAGASRDGKRVFFYSPQRLTSMDTDSGSDIYERLGGTTTLVSTGVTRGTASSFPAFRGSSVDGTHVFFESPEAMLPSDSDAVVDVYEARVGYEAPAAAESIYISLVPELRQTISEFQCRARGGTNSAHGPPLSFSSCQPPAYLPNTMARMGPEANGSAQLGAVPGDLDTSADEADLAIAGTVSDVRAVVGGGDYDPSLAGADVTLALRLRLTDSVNGSLLSDPATTLDFELKAPAACLPTVGPEGSDCSVNTSADALDAGSILEGRRMVLQSYDLRFRDSGANAARGDGDDRGFAMRGIYVP